MLLFLVKAKGSADIVRFFPRAKYNVPHKRRNKITVS